ncbi:hypothetical protein STEG23_036084 [Scotinomys teguina]
MQEPRGRHISDLAAVLVPPRRDSHRKHQWGRYFQAGRATHYRSQPVIQRLACKGISFPFWMQNDYALWIGEQLFDIWAMNSLVFVFTFDLWQSVDHESLDSRIDKSKLGSQVLG